jgi:hypothetical protein
MLDYLLARLCFAVSRVRGRESLDSKRAQEWWSAKARHFLSRYIQGKHGYSLDDAKAWDTARRERMARGEFEVRP